MLVWWEWFDRLRIWAIIGVIGVILLIEGDVTARIIGSVMVMLLLGSTIIRSRHRVARSSQ